MTHTIVIENREITDAEYGALTTETPPAVDMGLPWAHGQLMSERLSRPSKRFLLVWRGEKSPRGVEIPAGTIGGTQHGNVISTDWKRIGSYEQLEEFGGEHGDRHKMIVSVES